MSALRESAHASSRTAESPRGSEELVNLNPVTTVFARRVRPGSEPAYEEWLAGIARATSRFPGSQGTTILRPTEGRSEYVAIMQFDAAESLDAWLASTERSTWLSELRALEVCHEEVSTLAGMERWFTLSGSQEGLPPRYKTATLVLLGLYPLVLALDVMLGPLLASLPRPLAVLASLSFSVPIMVWLILCTYKLIRFDKITVAIHITVMDQ